MPLHKRQFDEGDEYKDLPPSDLMCRRVFNGDFKSGGRFYCGAQRRIKAERQSLRIDGQATVELDFKSLHPRMVYHLKGIEAPVDCYQSDKRDRQLTKLISLRCLNCKDKEQAIKAVIDGTGLTKEEAVRHLDDYESEHSAIRDEFYKSAWRYLQYMDSQITDTALERATEQGIPVLPIHDSYITRTRDVFTMRDILREVYREYLGFDPVLDWDR